MIGNPHQESGQKVLKIMSNLFFDQPKGYDGPRVKVSVEMVMEISCLPTAKIIR